MAQCVAIRVPRTGPAGSRLQRRQRRQRRPRRRHRRQAPCSSAWPAPTRHERCRCWASGRSSCGRAPTTAGCWRRRPLLPEAPWRGTREARLQTTGTGAAATATTPAALSCRSRVARLASAAAPSVRQPRDRLRGPTSCATRRHEIRCSISTWYRPTHLTSWRGCGSSSR